MSDLKVRLQNLRDCTVQIRVAGTEDIVGTGVAVSMDGKVVTCAHVVEDALGVHPRQADGAEVGVYFPKARGGEEKARRATVAGCFPEQDDDVVLLQLTGGAAPLAPEQIAVLGAAEPSEGNDFRSYGYSPIGDYPASRAEGTILGTVEPPVGQDLQTDPVQLRSREIAPGMSGAAVLDTERNLVVGLIAERYIPEGALQDDVGFAVDAVALTFDPLNLSLRDTPLEKRPAPEPKDVEAARQSVAPELGLAWNNAPAVIPEWVGREELLAALDRDWADPERRVTGLIGFGGEGKSSLARRWVEGLLADGSLPQPEGLFWWGFYERSVDEFFEAALVYMSGGRIDPREYPSSSAKAHLLAGMIYSGRYLFVLDGLEVLQHAEGDRYGLLTSGDLREFLSYFAAPGHDSFCLVTSRAPLLDLMDYTTYNHRDVSRLSPGDGRDLLRAVGVQGAEAALDQVVAEWDGHALTLSLLGGYLAERYGGDVARIDEIPAPTADEPRYERVHRVLRRYDEHLSEAEQAFLTLFSAFRTPVREAAFERVFRAPVEGRGGVTPPLQAPVDEGGATPPLRAPVAALDDDQFRALVKRLTDFRILRYDERERQYTAHPLVRAHYLARLAAGERAQAQDAHTRIKDYYLELAGDTPHNPTLEDLAPLIEVVHHACRAGAYDEAFRIQRDRIYQGKRRVLDLELGAYGPALALTWAFFPDGDTFQEPQVSDPEDKSWILNEVGLCLMGLGRLGEAVPFYERAVPRALEMEDWHNASVGYQNLANLHAHLGGLEASAQAAGEALAQARRAEDKRDECNSLVYQAWVTHLRGDLDRAGAAFAQAEGLEREINPGVRYLYGLRGIWHADHLLRAGDPAAGSGRTADHARQVTEGNLEICERNRWRNSISRCHRVLGDLDADPSTGSGQAPSTGSGRRDHESARVHYDRALDIGRGITFRPALIEALLARGRWAACYADLTGLRDPSGLAFGDLNEALAYAVAGGYRVYEADIRVALAWAHRAVLRQAQDEALDRAEALRRAQDEARRARHMSLEMGYHWGRIDAEEVLAALGD